MWPLSPKKTVKKRKPLLKRGKKQAQSLIRRRRLSLFLRGMTLGMVCFGFIFSVYIWKSGLAEEWALETGYTIDREISHAGFSVGEVRITGQNNTDSKDVRDALALYDGQSMVSLNLDEMLDRLKALPWVKSATIIRMMPNILDVAITEKTAVALWQEKGHIFLVNDGGEVIIEQGLKKFVDLPHVVGAGANEHLLEIFSMRDKHPDLFAQVKSSVWIGNRRWDLNFDNGIKIKLPEKGKDVAWQKLYDYEVKQKILTKEVMIVDLRQQGKMILRLTPQEAKRRRLARNNNKKAENI